MTAMMQLLDHSREKEKTEKIEFVRESDDTYKLGQLFCHDISKCLLSEIKIGLCILATIYMGDMAVLFSNRR